MAERVGLTYAWRDGAVHVIVSGGTYRPGIGDILYVRVESGYVLLQVSGFEGEIPVAASSLLAREGLSQHSYGVEKIMVAKATPIFEIREVGTGAEARKVVARPSQPPPLDAPVFLLKGGDEESELIMSLLSSRMPRSGEDAVPVAWLRAGIASVRELMPEKYFKSACLRLNVRDMVSKHVLISGQTSSGKTTGVMGIITQWARFGGRPVSWIIADRHGEYSGLSGFVDVLAKALELNDRLRGSYSGIHIFALKTDSEKVVISRESYLVTRLEGGLDAGSVNVYDFINAAGLPERDISELLEVASILATLIKNASEAQAPQRGEHTTLKRPPQAEEHRIDRSCARAFVSDGDEPTGNLLALIPLVTSNLVRYEGVGERDKSGVYRMLVNAGIYVNRLRDLRRTILSIFGWRERIESPVIDGRKVNISVIDDRYSVFKVSPVLKDPQSVITLLKALVSSAKELSGADGGSYPWSNARGGGLSTLASSSLDLGDLVSKLDEGAVVIVDVSKIPLSLGDMVIISVLRRLFEERMLAGVDEARRRPVVAVVSEEAPLYLSPERVSGPYNIFARLAREGRKFGIGLVALTQIATMIEKQILANFNTLIALRTKHRADISYLADIGVPVEALPSLSDREGYLYTPDLSVSEPIPVYVPAHFDYRNEIEEEFGRMIRLDKDTGGKIVRALLGGERE